MRQAGQQYHQRIAHRLDTQGGSKVVVQGADEQRSQAVSDQI